MDHASQRVRVGPLLGAAAVLAACTILPHSAARAGLLTEGAEFFTTGLACGSADAPVGVHKLLVRVRADAAAAAQSRRVAKRASPEPRGAHGTARAAKPPPSPQTRKIPQAEREPRGSVLRSFYTCSASPVPDLTAGTGWRLVGPLRHG
jgi:hypothetical protein